MKQKTPDMINEYNRLFGSSDRNLLTEIDTFGGRPIGDAQDDDAYEDEESHMGVSDMKIDSIEDILEPLGYDDLGELFADNPGALDALLTWLDSVPEHRTALAQWASQSHY